MELVPIKDKSNLVRDIHSKALLSTDTNALQQYENRKRLFQQNQALAEEVATMKQDLEQIKQLLLRLTGNN
jgi:hypothetical protein